MIGKRIERARKEKAMRKRGELIGLRGVTSCWMGTTGGGDGDDGGGVVVVAGSEDGSVSRWSGKTMRRQWGTGAHKNGAVSSVAMSGRWIWSGDDRGVLRVWDSDKGAEWHSINAHRSGVGCLAVAGTGSGGLLRVASGAADAVKLWDMRSDRASAVSKSGSCSSQARQLTAISMTSDGHWLCFGDIAGRLVLWELRANRQVLIKDRPLMGNQAPIAHCQFHSDQLLAIATHNRRLLLWDIGHWALVGALDHTQLTLPIKATIKRADQQLICAADDGIRLWGWGASKDSKGHTTPAHARIRLDWCKFGAMAIAGRLLVAAEMTREQSVHVWHWQEQGDDDGDDDDDDCYSSDEEWACGDDDHKSEQHDEQSHSQCQCPDIQFQQAMSKRVRHLNRIKNACIAGKQRLLIDALTQLLNDRAQCQLFGCVVDALLGNAQSNGIQPSTLHSFRAFFLHPSAATLFPSLTPVVLSRIAALSRSHSHNHPQLSS